MKEIHPSHEAYTGQPYLQVGQRVKFADLDGEIEEVRNVGSEEEPVFEYLVRYDTEKANEERGLLKSTDLTII